MSKDNLIKLPSKDTIQGKIVEAIRMGVEVYLTEEELTIAAADPDLIESIQAIWQNRLKVRIMTEGTTELFGILKDKKVSVKDKLEVFAALQEAATPGSKALDSPKGKPGRPPKENLFDKAIGNRE